MCVCEYLRICPGKFGYLGQLLLVFGRGEFLEIRNINRNYLLWYQLPQIKKGRCRDQMKAEAAMQISPGEKESWETDEGGKKMEPWWNEGNSRHICGWWELKVAGRRCGAETVLIRRLSHTSWVKFSVCLCVSSLTLFRDAPTVTDNSALLVFRLVLGEINGVLRQTTSPRAHVSLAGTFQDRGDANYLAVRAL